MDFYFQHLEELLFGLELLVYGFDFEFRFADVEVVGDCTVVVVLGAFRTEENRARLAVA